MDNVTKKSKVMKNVFSEFIMRLNNLAVEEKNANDGKLSNEAKETLESVSLLVNKYEPKREFRWTLELDGIDSYLLKDCQRPDFWFDNDNTLNVSPMQAHFYDPIAPSAAQQFSEWIKAQSNDVLHKREGTLKLLDAVGIVIEEWKLSGMQLQQVQFGNLDYASSEPLTIFVVFTMQSAELIF